MAKRPVYEVVDPNTQDPRLTAAITKLQESAKKLKQPVFVSAEQRRDERMLRRIAQAARRAAERVGGPAKQALEYLAEELEGK